jgi:hypothetical protein
VIQAALSEVYVCSCSGRLRACCCFRYSNPSCLPLHCPWSQSRRPFALVAAVVVAVAAAAAAAACVSPAHCSEPTPLSLPHSNFHLPTQPLRSPTTNTSAPRERCWTPSLRRSLPSAVRRCLARTLARTCTKHAHCTLLLKLTWHPSGHARCPSWPLTPRLAEQTLPSPCGTKNNCLVCAQFLWRAERRAESKASLDARQPRSAQQSSPARTLSRLERAVGLSFPS